MDKLISKDVLLKELHKKYDEWMECAKELKKKRMSVELENSCILLLSGMESAIQIVEKMPAIKDVAPVVHAKIIGDGFDLHRCSRCGHLLPYDVNGDAVDYWKCKY